MLRLLLSMIICVFPSFGNLEALFKCHHQTPYGKRSVKISATVLGNLALDKYADDSFKPRRMVMISRGKEHIFREHLYDYKRTFIEGELDITTDHYTITETFGKSFLKISRKPFETEDGMGQEIPADKWEFLAELVIHKNDGQTSSGKTVGHPFEVELEGDDFLNLMRCSMPHDVSQKRIFEQLYRE